MNLTHQQQHEDEGGRTPKKSLEDWLSYQERELSKWLRRTSQEARPSQSSEQEHSGNG